MDEATNNLWEGPMIDHSCSEFVRVLADYRRFVRVTMRSELAVVRTDCDPVFTVNHHGATHNTAELQRYLDSALPAVAFEHSPPPHSSDESSGGGGPSSVSSPQLLP